MKTLTALLSLLFLFSSCGESRNSPRQTTPFSGNAMTIDYKIIVGDALDHSQYEEVNGLIAATFSEVNTVYNNWNPESEISRLNRLPSHTTVPLSPKLMRLLERTQEIVELTEGLFDPTVEPIHALWKSKMQEGKVPSDEEIAAIAPAIGWNKIHFDQNSFSKDHDNTRMDFGGIAKGLCVDLLVENLNGAGYPNVYVEWGGEIRATGMHPENRPWKIFISNLGDPDPEHAIDHLSISENAIASSGDYWQYWIIPHDDKKSEDKDIYTHIVNPLTLRALKATPRSVASANVLTKDCTLADALATAAMLCSSVEEACEWSEKIKEKIPETQFWFISRLENKELM